MKSIHLTDEILQGYLLNEVSDDAIGDHLKGCPICQQRLEAYRLLIKGIQETKIESFPFDVSALAMNTIIRYEKKRRVKQEILFWGLLILLCMVIISLSIPFMPQMLTLFSGKFSSLTLLVMSTGFLVLLIVLTDISRQFKMKENKIFNDHLQPIL